MPISLLDTDLYKFTMMQAVLHNYPSAWVEYGFKWRNWDKMSLEISPEQFIGRLDSKLDELCSLEFRPEELGYMSSIPFLKRDYIEYLRTFRLNRSYIRASVVDGTPDVRITGPWVSTILFETPTLAEISELYSSYCGVSKIKRVTEGSERLKNKLSMLDASLHKDQEFSFSDLGTRRRESLETQEKMLRYTLAKHRRFLAGTSNVYLAMKYNIKAVGTMAHEWLQAHQQLGPRVADSQKVALQTWASEYRGELGIALSDVMGFDAFLKDFDRYFALLFDGCRHDSGDPVWWCRKLIKHYEDLRIDPRTKTAIFSDGLTFETAISLFRMFHTFIKVAFGIGTYLTNDCGFLAPQIVLKLVSVDGAPVAKISDSVGKGMCEDSEFEKYLRQIIKNKIS